ncbi:MAG: nuclease-related domain-containing protein [Woeseia sp.]
MPVTLCLLSDAALGAGTTTGLGDGRSAIVLSLIAAAIVAGLLTRHHSMQFVNRMVAGTSKRRLQQALRNAQLESLHNLVLPGACDGLTRIDHAVLTSAGVICIRSKHVNGIVFANANDPQWLVVDGVEQSQFLNPLIQNDGRVNAVRRVLPEMPVFSLVVFTGKTQFSTPPSDNVIHLAQLPLWLHRFQEQHESAQNHDDAWLTLRAAALTDEASLRDFEAQLSFG